MRLFMQFSPSFLTLPVAAIDVLKEKDVEFVGGLYYGTRRFYDWLIDQPQCKGKPIFYPDPEELEWAQQPLNRSELERIRDTYGDDALHKIIIGDRHIGFGYVNGAHITPTSLTMAIKAGGPNSIWQYVVSLITHTEKILDETKPDVIFQYVIAGAVSLAFQFVAEHRNIKLLKFVHTRLESGMFIADTTKPAQRIIDHCQHPENLSQESLVKAKAQLNKIRAKSNVPEYMILVKSDVKKANSYRSLVKSICKLGYGIMSTKHDTPRSSRFYNGLRDTIKPFKYRIHSRALKKLGVDFKQVEDQSFAYYPLHVDPEASTIVLAPDYTDQLHVIQSISRSLPVGMKLIVKEHDPVVGFRPRDFYSRIASMPGVVLMKPDANTQNIIRTASVIITITGTGGLEAALMGKPVVVMGNPYYRQCQPGIVYLLDHPSLKDAINTAIEGKPASDDEVLHFLAAMNEIYFPIPSEYLWTTLAQEDSEQLRASMNLFAEDLATQCGK